MNGDSDEAEASQIAWARHHLSDRIELAGSIYSLEELLPHDAAKHSVGTQAIYLAVASAVHDMVFTSGRAGFNEEHQTASLMGHLSSNLCWYASIAIPAVGEDERGRLSRIQWASHTKTEEARSGVDFGVIAGLTDEDGISSVYRVALFQAKKAIDVDLAFKISYPTLPGNNDKETRSDRFDDTFKDVTADVACLQLLPPRTDPMLRPVYQLEALMRTQLKGCSLAGYRHPWCHYAVWPIPSTDGAGNEVPMPSPVAVAVLNIATDIKDKGKPGSYKPTCSTTVIDVLCDALAGVQGNVTHCIELDAASLGSLLLEVAKLLPGATLVAASDEGSGGGLQSALDEAGFTTADFFPSAVPPPGPAPTMARVPSGP